MTEFQDSIYNEAFIDELEKMAKEIYTRNPFKMMHVESRAMRESGSKGLKKIIASQELQDIRTEKMDEAEKTVKYTPYMTYGGSVGATLGATGLALFNKIKKLPGTGKAALIGALLGGGIGTLAGAMTASDVKFNKSMEALDDVDAKWMKDKGITYKGLKMSITPEAQEQYAKGISLKIKA